MAERLDDLGKSWARDLRAADRADKTVRVYAQALDSFRRWLAAQDREQTADALTKATISAWLADLHTTGSASNTIKTHFRGMRRFCKWAAAECEIDGDPMATLEQPRGASKPVPIISDEAIAKLFKATDGSTFVDRRDHAILRVLFDCGLRISECASLLMDSVDMDVDVLIVMGKGRKPRAVPFGAKTGRALDRYLRERRKHPHADDPRLWLTQRGGMSTDGLDDRLRVRARQASVEGLHAHMFRHRFAHAWLADGGQEQDLKRLAGWTSDAMLAVYGASAATERAHNAFRQRRLGDRL